MKKIQVDIDQLWYAMTEETGDTFQSNKVFSDPQTSGPVEKFVVNPEGGLNSYIKGQKYPYPGYPFRHAVKNACIIKRTMRLVMNFISSMANPKGIIKLIMIRKQLKDFFPKFLILFSMVIGSRRLKERFYNHGARELYRVFNLVIEREQDPKLKRRWKKIRDIVCFIVQFDPAYGYRFMDFLNEIDQKKIKLSKRDLYYARKSENYDYGGKGIKND